MRSQVPLDRKCQGRNTGLTFRLKRIRTSWLTLSFGSPAIQCSVSGLGGDRTRSGLICCDSAVQGVRYWNSLWFLRAAITNSPSLGGLAQQKYSLSLFWRLEVQIQGVSRVTLFLKALGESSSLSLLISCGPRDALACGSVSVVPASVFTWPFPWVCLPLCLLHEMVNLERAELVFHWLLVPLPCQSLPLPATPALSRAFHRVGFH